MDEKICSCYLMNDNGLKALYVEDLEILISSNLKSNRIVSDKKVKSAEKLLTKFKKVGIFRVRKVSYTGAFFERREFVIKQSMIMELLDEQGYEIRG